MMRLGHLPTEEELKRMVAEVGPGFFVSRIWCSSGMIWYLFIYLFRWTKTKMEQLSWTNFCTWWLTGQKWNIDFRNQNKRHCGRSFMFWYFFLAGWRPMRRLRMSSKCSTKMPMGGQIDQKFSVAMFNITHYCIVLSHPLAHHDLLQK